MKTAALLGVFASGALAAVGPWGQCGGQNWSGETTCVSGYTCTFSNQWYSQCLPGNGPPAPTSTTLRTSTTQQSSTTQRPSSTSSTSKSAAPSSTAAPGKFKWFGVDESVAEFAYDAYPGTWGKHFRFPDNNAVQTLINEGFNTFRIPFLMERMAVNSIGDRFDQRYLANLTETVNYITSRGKYAVLDPHNYGRYKGSIITDIAAFKTFFSNLANAFKNNEYVIFDTNNEYHTMDQSLVFDLNQAAIDAIRGAGATRQWILAEGNFWSGAWHWVEYNDNLKNLRDPENKLVYQMHQYLDSDGSGTNAQCVSRTIGAERLSTATKWLRDNGKLGILGEYAGGANDVCKAAITGLLDHLKENSDVWTGALWWAAGPWWGDYMYSFEPPSGTAYLYYDSLLRKYVP
ncbi:Endoglucanase 3 [Paramyrothecium foliicola]|nr:Endoglucanase 3 [Paramyrothecium foliicola]